MGRPEPDRSAPSARALQNILIAQAGGQSLIKPTSSYNSSASKLHHLQRLMQLNHYFSLASLVVLALLVSQINASAYLFVVHGVSNFDGNTNVNVNINGSRVISNFAYTST